MELDHLEETFVEINNFPRKVVKRVFRQVEQDLRNKPASITATITEQNQEQKIVQITLPYAGKTGEIIVKEINKEFKKLNNQNLKARFAYKAKRLSSCFNIKDRIKQEHLHNVVYEISCPDCDQNYIGETERRIEERVKDHVGRDRNSHVGKHALETGHNEITMNNVKIVNKNYKNYYKRKISEALYIKQRKPVLNIQDTSVPLRLLN